MLKKVYKAILVDDEVLARKALRNLLKDHKEVEIIAEAESVMEAVEIINKLKPDLLFLDIQMPGESGFDLFDHVEFSRHIIFVTAFDKYALRAFEINALDYLLKPISPERLSEAIKRLELTLPDTEKEKVLDYNDRLFILMGRQMVFLKISSIVYIQSDGDYSKVYTIEGNRGLILKSMREWDSRLPETYFCRVHRSSIINLEFVDKIEKEFNYDFSIYLTGMTKPVRMSRRYARSLKEKMG